MKAQASSGTVCAPLLIYMVAGSYWCPSLLAGGLRVDPRAQEPGIAVTMTDAFKNNNAVLPPWPGEQPKTSAVKEWYVAAKPCFTPDQLAVYGRTDIRGLLDFTDATVPEALPLVTADNGMTESTRQSRLALIMTITDANNLKTRKRAAFTSEIAQSMFDALDRAVRPQAPLLWAKLERTCKQSAPFEHCFDGGEALRILVAMGDAAAMQPGEESMHEAHMLMLTLKPLPEGSLQSRAPTAVLAGPEGGGGDSREALQERGVDEGPQQGPSDQRQQARRDVSAGNMRRGGHRHASRRR